MSNESPDDLLRPSEVAELFGVRTPTIARWAREGRLTALLTPGGHRRYSRAAIQRLVEEETTPREAEQQLAQDAARLYDQGWSIRQVAERFECSYGVMRRLLSGQIGLRPRGETYASVYREDRA
jgi:excisionase family DNA binding protein